MYMYYTDPRRQMADYDQAQLLKLCRMAVPEISEDAEIILVEHNPYYLPGGTRVDLNEYQVQLPNDAIFARLTMGHYVFDGLPYRELVFVLVSQTDGAKYYIVGKDDR